MPTSKQENKRRSERRARTCVHEVINGRDSRGGPHMAGRRGDAWVSSGLCSLKASAP
jgi:hypothetical protein